MCHGRGLPASRCEFARGAREEATSLSTSICVPPLLVLLVLLDPATTHNSSKPEGVTRLCWGFVVRNASVVDL